MIRTCVNRGMRVSKTLGTYPDSKVHGANMGPTWGRQDPGGPYVGHMNLAIWVLNITFRFDRHHCSWAASTLTKSTHDSKSIFVRIKIFLNGEINKRSFEKPHTRILVGYHIKGSNMRVSRAKTMKIIFTSVRSDTEVSWSLVMAPSNYLKHCWLLRHLLTKCNPARSYA